MWSASARSVSKAARSTVRTRSTNESGVTRLGGFDLRLQLPAQFRIVARETVVQPVREKNQSVLFGVEERTRSRAEMPDVIAFAMRVTGGFQPGPADGLDDVEKIAGKGIVQHLGRPRSPRPLNFVTEVGQLTVDGERRPAPRV